MPYGHRTDYHGIAGRGVRSASMVWEYQMDPAVLREARATTTLKRNATAWQPRRHLAPSDIAV